MANSIALFKKYIDLLDEVYKGASLTSALDIDSTMVRAGANANEIIIPKISMDGLGDYSRSGGYVSGSVKLTNETVTFNYDRGRSFSVDAMDNEESAGIAFGRLSAEFLRTKAAPEQDAFRFASYAGLSGISRAEDRAFSGDNAAKEILNALIESQNTMDEDEVPGTERYLYITPTLYNLIQNIDTTKSKAVLSSFASITKAPQSRFYTAIDLRDGIDHSGSAGEDESMGGFRKAAERYKACADTVVTSGKTYYTKSGDSYTAVESPSGNPSLSGYYELVSAAGRDINFLVIHKPAVIQYNKHTVNKVITPEANQTSDGWLFFYRSYGLVDAYENKRAGIYLHASTT